MPNEATVLEIARFWEHYNYYYLAECLRRPVFRIDLATSRLGTWNSTERTLTLSAHHILNDPWSAVMETLRHEMAHQYVDEMLDGQDNSPHGSAFRAACRLLRVSPAASGKGGEISPLVVESGPSDDAVRDKIGKLLSLATSPNEHEAHLAMEKARQLLLKYNLSLSDLSGLGEGKERYSLRQLGGCITRRQRYESEIGLLLSQFFFVKVMWDLGYDPHRKRRGSLLLIHGTPVNLDMAEYVYQFLNQLLPQLWRQHQQGTGDFANAPRLHYYWGVVRGFRDRLREQDTSLVRSRAMVWLGDPGLQVFYRFLYPRVTTVGRSSINVHDSFDHGRREGRQISLRKPVEERGSGIRGFLQ